jgi:hypothetical protein
LSNIKRSRLEADKLTFEWKEMGENPSYVQYFKMPEANACIELISSNLKQLENLLTQRESSRPRIMEEEVSRNRIESVDIEGIMRQITELEGEVKS